MESNIVPVVKWAGGKRQLLPVIDEILPPKYNKYYEPFIGGGALYCHLKPEKASINDANPRLINMYLAIMEQPDEVCSLLENYQHHYNSLTDMTSKDIFYQNIRDQFNSEVDAGPKDAARLIFLNKAGFNGLYRVNTSGYFNVPSGHKETLNLFDRDNIKGLSELLKSTIVTNRDFYEACEDAEEDDFVFFDSPYYDTFDSYQATGFSDCDHIRLARLFDRLTSNGVYCMLTNSDSEFIRSLYSRYTIRVVDVKRMINCDGNNRTGKEIIVTNY